MNSLSRISVIGWEVVALNLGLVTHPKSKSSDPIQITYQSDLEYTGLLLIDI